MNERQGYNPEEHVARLTSEGENSTLKQNSFSENIQKGGFNMGDRGDNIEQPPQNIDMDDLSRQIYAEVERRVREGLTQEEVEAMNSMDSWEYVPKDDEQSKAPETVATPETISEKAAKIREGLNGSTRDILLRKIKDPNQGIRYQQRIDSLLKLEDDQQLIEGFEKLHSEVFSFPKSRDEYVEDASPQASEETLSIFDDLKDQDEFIQKLLENISSSHEGNVRIMLRDAGEALVRISATGTGREEEYARQLEEILSEVGNIKAGVTNLLAEIRADVATIEDGADQTYEEAISMPSGLTQEAQDLLEKVDSGSVPGFVSNNLRRLANENGVEVADGMTPNEIIEALRAKSSIDTPDGATGTGDVAESSGSDETAEPEQDKPVSEDAGRGRGAGEPPAPPDGPNDGASNDDEPGEDDEDKKDDNESGEDEEIGKSKNWFDALSESISKHGEKEGSDGTVEGLNGLLEEKIVRRLKPIENELYDKANGVTWKEKIDEIMNLGNIEDMKLELSPFLRKLKNTFTEKEASGEREHLPESFEELLELIMNKETDEFKTGGRRELMTEKGEIRPENFYQWVRSKAVYWSDFNSDSVSDLFNLISIPMTYRDINLHQMMTNSQFFRRRERQVHVDEEGEPTVSRNNRTGEVSSIVESSHSDDHYIKIKDTIQQDLFIYNYFRNFNIQYIEVMEQDSELPKRSAEIFSKNHLTQKGKEGLKTVLSLPSTAFSDITGQGKKSEDENYLAGEGVAMAFSIYDNISDYDKLVELLGEDSAYFAKNYIKVKEGNIYESLTIATEEKGLTLENLESARDKYSAERDEDVEANVSGVGQAIRFDEDWFDANDILKNEDWAKYQFLDYMNVYNEAKKDTRIIDELRERIRQTLVFKMLPRLEESDLHQRLRLDSRKKILGREGLDMEGLDQIDAGRRGELETEIEFESKKLLLQFAYDDAKYAEEVAKSMVRWTGTGAKNDTTATGFDAGTKYFDTMQYRGRQGDEKRGGGGVGAIKDLAIYKRLLAPVMRGVLTSTTFDEFGKKKLTPAELTEFIAKNIGKKAEKAVSTGSIKNRIVFADNATKDYGGNHYMRGGATFESLAGAEMLDLSKIVTYDPYKGNTINKAELIEQVNERYLKTERYRTATYDGVAYDKKFKFLNGIINNSREETIMINGVEKRVKFRNLKYEEQYMVEAMYGAQVFDRDYRKADKSIDIEKVVDNRSAFWKEGAAVRIASQLAAYTDSKDPVETWNISRIEAFMTALEQIPADIHVDEKDFWKSKARKRFFNEALEKHMRKLAKIEKWRIYSKAYAGNVGSGLLAGMLEVAKEFAEETIAA